MSEKLRQAEAILNEAIDSYNPDAVLGLFSGGHDSLTVTHFTANLLGPRMDAVAHINTGIGIPETRQFVRDTCKRYGWKLDEREAANNVNARGEPDPQVYEDIVLKHGFPGPGSHRIMYSRLKERPLRGLIREYKKSRLGRVMLVTGVRREESSRRMGTVHPIQKQGAQIWVAPFTHMTGSDLDQYMRSHDLPRNPVKDNLCMSGECLCGAFAKSGELREIRFWYPEAAAEIRRIEQKAFDAGFPWGWEDKGPPSWWRNKKRAENVGQQDAFSNDLEMLCTNCHKAYEESGE